MVKHKQVQTKDGKKMVAQEDRGEEDMKVIVDRD